MAFKPGDKKPAGSGRKPGQKNKNRIIRLNEFLRSENINLAKELFSAINAVQDPAAKARLLLELYRFIDAPVREKDLKDLQEDEEKPEQQEEPASILNIINDK